MGKELPKVFANKIDHEISNNDKVFYSFVDQKKDDRTPTADVPTITGLDTKQKLRSIFNSPVFVYKAKVAIVLQDKTITKEIVGYNDRNVMTMDDEVIPISDIKDIYFVK